jgi:hypothetical protein
MRRGSAEGASSDHLTPSAVRHCPAMARLASLLAMIVTACTSDAPVSATAAAPEPATARECGPAQQEDLTRALVGTCTEPSLLETKPLAIATWAPVAELEPDGFAVMITPDGIGISGNVPAAWNELDFRAQLRNANEKARQIAEATGKTFTPRFVLAIHRDTRLSAVDPVLHALATEKVDRGFLAFASGTRPRTSPPRHPELYAAYVADVESQDAFERAAYLAKKLEPLAVRCPALQVGFHAVAATDGPSRCATLMTAAASAIVECGCPEYEPELVSWLQVMVGPADAAHLHVDAVELAPTKAIEADAATTWGTFIAERRAPLPALWLDLAG